MYHSMRVDSMRNGALCHMCHVGTSSNMYHSNRHKQRVRTVDLA